jgi:hypothetical protein
MKSLTTYIRLQPLIAAEKAHPLEEILLVRNFAYVVQNIGWVLGEGDFFSVLELKKLLESEVTVGRLGSDSRHGPTGWIYLPSFMCAVWISLDGTGLSQWVALITVRGGKCGCMDMVLHLVRVTDAQGGCTGVVVRCG